MAQVTVTINSREYPIACESGQEARIMQLAGVLEEKARLLKDISGQISENMLLAMIGILVADDLLEARKNNPRGGRRRPDRCRRPRTFRPAQGCERKNKSCCKTDRIIIISVYGEVTVRFVIPQIFRANVILSGIVPGRIVVLLYDAHLLRCGSRQNVPIRPDGSLFFCYLSTPAAGVFLINGENC